MLLTHRVLSLQRIGVLLFISCALFFVGNNLFSLTDPDEVFYCLSAKEMAARHEAVVPFIFGQPQFEKPVLTFWLIQSAFRFFGDTPFAARFFPAFFATAGVIGVYLLGFMGLRDERKAFLSALSVATCAFFVGMGKTVFTDMIFSVLILYAMASFLWGFLDSRKTAFGMIGFYVFCALAVLTKGPLGWLVPQASVVLFLLYQRRVKFLANGWVIAGLVLCMGLVWPWYHYMFSHYGQAFIREFFYNDHWRRLFQAEHRGNDRWFFYPVTMIAGFFPWSLFLLAGLADLFKRLKALGSVMDYFSLSWILTVFCIFQLAHSKLSSYILPMFPALGLVTGNFLGNCLSDIHKPPKLKKLLSFTFLILAILGILVLALEKIYIHYLSSLGPMYFLSASLIVISGLGLSLTIKEHFQAALYMAALTISSILLTAVMLRVDIEGYVSSRQASFYIPQRNNGVVLTSKTNVRGIRYYTGADVAVVDGTRQPFFSPHPVSVLNSKEKVVALLKKQPVTYGVIRKGAYQAVLRYCAFDYQVLLLNKMGYDYVVKITPLKK